MAVCGFSNSMSPASLESATAGPVRMAATAAWTGHCRRTIRSRTCRRENRELLLELCGMAARTFGHRVRAHEGLELIAAGLTGVFVDRHGVFLLEGDFRARRLRFGCSGRPWHRRPARRPAAVLRRCGASRHVAAAQPLAKVRCGTRRLRLAEAWSNVQGAQRQRRSRGHRQLAAIGCRDQRTPGSRRCSGCCRSQRFDPLTAPGGGHCQRVALTLMWID